MSSPQILLSLIATVLAALISVVLVRATRPILQRVALAKPNARSSHRVPTPQGAGVAVTAATLLAGGIVIGLAGSPDLTIPFTVFAACLFIAVVGLADDILSLPVVPRLLLQAAAVAAVVFSVPSDLRLAQSSPVWLERGLLLIAGLWFVNLVNFMMKSRQIPLQPSALPHSRVAGNDGFTSHREPVTDLAAPDWPWPI